MATEQDGTAELTVVRTWHAALNRGDIDGLLACSSDEVEVGGPRGTGKGHALLRGWLERAGITLEVLRSVQRGPVVVVEQAAEWRDADTGAVVGSDTVASVFEVRDGKVTRVLRYDDGMPAALEAVGITDEATGA